MTNNHIPCFSSCLCQLNAGKNAEKSMSVQSTVTLKDDRVKAYEKI